MSTAPDYSLSHAARLLGVSDDTVRRWADAQKLRTKSGPGRRRVVAGRDLAAFAASLADEPDAARTSARNTFPGIVTAVKSDKVVAQVDIQAGPHRVVSLMTAEAVDELGLTPGVEVRAIVKAPAVVVELA